MEYEEKIIDAVAGDMSIEGMELSEEDKQRIREYAFDIDQIDKVVGELVKKHDVTGTELTPGDPENCPGNGVEDPMKCCCDECDYLQECLRVKSED